MTADFLLPQCRGGTRLIEQLDRAVQAGNAGEVAAAVERVLLDAIADPGIELPSVIREPVEGHYARREIYRSAAHGYSVIAMTWAPGQGTKIHDHSGMWCVEGVWLGRLEITQYELAEQAREQDLYRFVAAGTIDAGTGSAGSLIPPHEYHTIRNPSDRDIAVSRRVYQRTMVRCGVFSPEADDSPWQSRGERLLGTDQVVPD